MGLLMSIIFGDYAIVKARKNQVFMNRKREYGNSIEKIDPYLQYCDDYCQEKNEIRLTREKTKYLRRYGIRYDDFVNDRLDYSRLNENQQKALQKVDQIKIFQLDMEYLLSDCDEVKLNKGRKTTISSYKAKTYGKNIITKVLTAIVFGFFTVDKLKDPNISSIIWYAIQICIWIAMAMITYVTNYMYMTEEYCQNVIILKTNYLHEFYNLMVENPNRYKQKREEKNENIIFLPPLREEDANK